MMTTAVSANPMASTKGHETVEIDDDDEDVIEEDQLEEYGEMIEQLGSFPDKVQINTLSMVAGDHAESKAAARSIYSVIRKRLLSTSRDNMLPLVYLLDSILKNVKGKYLEIVEEDAKNWMPSIYQQLHDDQRAKLQKVWKTWGEFKIFSPESLKAMGRCFDDRTTVGTTLSTVAGISRTKDGTLLLSSTLRGEMQNILDEIQKDEQNELNKVSLERLADLNPDLLAKIKQTAEDNIRSGSQLNVQESVSSQAPLPSFFAETRSQATLERSKEWSELKWDYLEQTHEVITKLQHRVREDASSDQRYTQQEAIEMTQYLAAASSTASLLTASMERIKNQEDQKDKKRRVSFPGVGNSSIGARSAAIDKSLFTNDGIKKKNEAIIGLLYEVGLPFVSSADGRRFATQLELSNHLDALFKRNQLEKSIARTEERGWYIADIVWIGEAKEEELKVTELTAAETVPAAADDGFAPETSTMPADEMRDRCVICGINFKMFFDNDDGIYKYSNCREIQVLNDDAAEKESEDVLVHVSCVRGLGSPEVLTMDQALQETLHH